MKFRRRIALAGCALILGLYAVSLAHAQSVTQNGQSFRGVIQGQLVNGVYWPDSTARALSLSSSGALSVQVSNPTSGVAFYTQNALLATGTGLRLREVGNLAALPARWRDSTAVMSTYGAKRIEVWLYVAPDSSVNALLDSTRVVLVGIQPRAHINTLADTSSWAGWQVLKQSSPTATTVWPDSSVGWTGHVVGDFAQVEQYAGTARNSSAMPLLGNNLLPGEIVIPYVRGWIASSGGALPNWQKFDICVPQGCFASEYISFAVRIIGHTTIWPMHPTGWLSNPAQPYAVRMDVKGYYQ